MKYQNFFMINRVIGVFLSTLCNAISTVYLLQKGFSLSVISSVYAFALILNTLFEYPSGAIADYFGRKRIYALGMFFRGLQCLFYVLADSPLFLFVGAFFESIYSSLTSGSLEAWLKGVDDKKINYNHLFGLCKMLSSIVSIGLLLITSLFIDLNLKELFLFCTLFYVGMMFFNLLLFEDNKGNQETILSYQEKTFKFYLKSKKMIEISIVLSIAYGFISIYMLYFQAKGDLIGVSDHFYTLASSISLLGGMISGYYLSKYNQEKSKWNIILYCFVGILFSFIFFLLSSNSIMLLVGNFIYGLSSSIIMPVFYSWMMDLLIDDNLATSISLLSGIAGISASFTTFLVGHLISLCGLDVAMYIGLLLGIISLLLIFRLIKGEKNA